MDAVKQQDARDLLSAGSGAFGQDLQRDTMKDRIAGKIATLIASGVLSVGDALPSERELAAALSVSRETVRGAILILSTRGILSVVQGLRTTVVSTDVGAMAVEAARYRDVARYELDDVHQARLMVEGRVVREAACRISRETLSLLRKSIEAQEKCVDDPVRFLICDREFHTAIYKSCGNDLLADMATDLYSYLLDHRRRIVARPGSIGTSISDHRAILAGLEAGDPEAVARGFCVHETRIYETTQSLLNARAEGAS